MKNNDMRSRLNKWSGNPVLRPNPGSRWEGLQARIIARSPYPILEPEESYELWGSANNVVFPCGSVLLGDEIFVYYGAADTVCGVATAKFDLLLEYVLQFAE